MNTTVTSRPNAASKAALLSPSSDNLPSPSSGGKNNKNNRTTKLRKGKKGNKKSTLPMIVGGICFLHLVAFMVLVTRGGYGSDSVSTNGTSTSTGKGTVIQKHTEHHVTAEYEEVNVRRAKAKATTATTKARLSFDNPYEGWQPVINWDQDKNDAANNNNVDCNSWRTCLSKTDKCHAKCRDSPEDFGTAPFRPGFTPDPDLDEIENLANAQAVPWIPDVTVLRRMLVAGKDEHGNPWPPPLVTDTDRELCEAIGNFGGANDEHKTLLDAVPIRGMPLLGNSEWTDAAFTSKKMGRQPKVMCLVYTMKENHHTNIRVIRETWGPGCDGFLAFSTKDDPRIPAISIPHDGAEEYTNMWQKIRSIWRFVGTHYLEDFDFFFQGGEDLYVLPQNLRSVLADQVADPTTEDFFGGRRFQWGNSDVFFNSGGAGYALSQATLRKLVPGGGLDDPDCFPNKHSSMEDVFIAKCLKKVFDIGVVDTRDEKDRERFHPFGPAGHYNWRPPVPPAKDWYETYNAPWPPRLKEECCAPDSVSFHYLKKPAMVRHIHSLLYFCD